MSGRTCRVLLACVLACAGCGKKEKSTPELLDDLKGADEQNRMIAVRTLPSRSGDAAQVVPALVGCLKDRSVNVRVSAAIGLGSFGEGAAEAVPGLQAALSDSDLKVREAAGKALTRIDPARFPTAPKSSPPKGK
jgi:HEAT repeat protein